MGTGDPAHSVVAGVIVNLKLETHSCQGITGSPWYQSAARCLKLILRKRIKRVKPARGSGQRSNRSCTDLFVLTRILKEAGKANRTVYAFFLGRA
jgi:hypothetical protein